MDTQLSSSFNVFYLYVYVKKKIYEFVLAQLLLCCASELHWCLIFFFCLYVKTKNMHTHTHTEKVDAFVCVCLLPLTIRLSNQYFLHHHPLTMNELINRKIKHWSLILMISFLVVGMTNQQFLFYFLGKGFTLSLFFFICLLMNVIIYSRLLNNKYRPTDSEKGYMNFLLFFLLFISIFPCKDLIIFFIFCPLS